MEEQNYYGLGKRRIKKKNNGRQHTTIIEGTYYNWRLFYISAIWLGMLDMTLL
jgi:hypothetical protein